MPLGRPNDPRSRLTPAHEQALVSANALLIDWAFDALEDLRQGASFERLELWPFLPSTFAVAYGVAFFRRFAVCLTSVGLKLRAPEPQAVASIAEGLALLAMTSVAGELLQRPHGPAEFGVWYAAVCPHPSVARLFDASAAEARRSASMERILAAVDQWFRPFERGALLSPYLDDGAD